MPVVGSAAALGFGRLDACLGSSYVTNERVERGLRVIRGGVRVRFDVEVPV